MPSLPDYIPPDAAPAYIPGTQYPVYQPLEPRFDREGGDRSYDPLFPPLGPVTGPEPETPLALLNAQAASKPPWQISEDEAQRYLAAGVPMETLLSIPGRLA